MARNRTAQLKRVIVAAVLGLLFPALAQAVPNYAQQTGQPCTACHIGAYGPQLTAFGRAFKIGGYTQTGGDEGTPIPLVADAARLLQQHNQGAGRARGE